MSREPENCTVAQCPTPSVRGYYGIGIFKGKTVENLGTLWRSANLFDANFIFTIGGRYKKQASDTTKAFRHIPLYDYATFENFYQHLPYGCPLVGVEMDAHSEDIRTFKHPERCIYLLGAEDEGLPEEVRTQCHKLVRLPGRFSLNVAVAGSLVMFDRAMKHTTL
ncbi:MAG: RNA methyltransferase [Dysgonamonadaceae bacterium]|jgi:tRNA G18 (ribose-2'-O)-methylase SpoU|nr:RNA methyltransferase [Dysgonamonadaceae bacterium]